MRFQKVLNCFFGGALVACSTCLAAGAQSTSPSLVGRSVKALAIFRPRRIASEKSHSCLGLRSSA